MSARGERSHALHDASVHAVLRALRHATERGAVTTEQMQDIARVQLMRPGAPLFRSSAEARGRFDAALAVLAATVDGPPTSRVLYDFAKAAAEAAHALTRAPRHPGVRIAERATAKGSTRQLAEAALYAEATRSKDGEDMVRRAVTRAIRERKKTGGLMRLDMPDGDPLRALLDLPRAGAVVLPRNDLRARISETSQKSGFGAILRKAARFAEELLRPAIGEELWELGRPVGFADKAETRVLVEVTSSVRAQEIQLRSPELLEKLRAVDGMSGVRGVQVVLRAPSALAVRGRRTQQLSDE